MGTRPPRGSGRGRPPGSSPGDGDDKPETGAATPGGDDVADEGGDEEEQQDGPPGETEATPDATTAVAGEAESADEAAPTDEATTDSVEPVPEETPELAAVGAGTTAAPVAAAAGGAGSRRAAGRIAAAGGASKGATSVPNYLSPGVYVEEVPSAVKPIAGVGTSTAGFIGFYPDRVTIPVSNPNYDPTARSQDNKPVPPEVLQPALLIPYPPEVTPEQVTEAHDAALAADAAVRDWRPGAGGATREELMRTAREASENALRLSEDLAAAQRHAPPGVPKLCTSFSDFERYFGTFSNTAEADAAGHANPNGHSDLAHAVYGFFNNGGSRCWVMRSVETPNLQPFETIDEIAIVAAPGLRDPVVQGMILDHCENMKDRFAVLDAPRLAPEAPPVPDTLLQRESNFGAVYFPDIEVFDVAFKTREPQRNGRIPVPPSGHVAGIYARVDAERGVHKAPANEVIRGALDVTYPVSKAIQAGLNPRGVNCIRNINGNIRVWGARTLGGDSQADYKYINVRRLMLFIEESIDEGTQWVVFEPNDDRLWAKIVRNVTAFLTVVWRDGALFGVTPAEAFYVKCDRSTNPPEIRDLGRVVCEIGVAPVRPAEFVIFRITQWAGPQGQ